MTRLVAFTRTPDAPPFIAWPVEDFNHAMRIVSDAARIVPEGTIWCVRETTR